MMGPLRGPHLLWSDMKLVCFNGSLLIPNDYEWSGEIPTFNFGVKATGKNPDVMDLVDTTADTRATYAARQDGDERTWVRLGTVLDHIVEAIR